MIGRCVPVTPLCGRLVRGTKPNGLVVADAKFAQVSLRHIDVSADKSAAAAQAVAESTPRVLDAVTRWQATELSPLARHDFAARALALRWGSTQWEEASSTRETHPLILAPCFRLNSSATPHGR